MAACVRVDIYVCVCVYIYIYIYIYIWQCLKGAVSWHCIEWRPLCIGSVIVLIDWYWIEGSDFLFVFEYLACFSFRSSFCCLNSCSDFRFHFILILSPYIRFACDLIPLPASLISLTLSWLEFGFCFVWSAGERKFWVSPIFVCWLMKMSEMNELHTFELAQFMLIEQWRCGYDFEKFLC